MLTVESEQIFLIIDKPGQQIHEVICVDTRIGGPKEVGNHRCFSDFKLLHVLAETMPLFNNVFEIIEPFEGHDLLVVTVFCHFVARLS